MLVLDNEVPYATPSLVAVLAEGGARRSCREPGAMRATGGPLADGTEFELRSRLVDVDPLAQRVDARDARVPLWRDGELSPRRSTSSR